MPFFGIPIRNGIPLGLGSTLGLSSSAETPSPFEFGIYLNIQDINATPINTFFARNSVDSGNNSGWVFILNAEYLNIVDSNATPSNMFAVINCVDGGNNVGWEFL